MSENGFLARGRCASCGEISDLFTSTRLCVTCWCERQDANAGVTKRYWLRFGDGPEREVTKSEWVAAERSAGFHNTLNRPDEPATGSFYTAHCAGRVERITAPLSSFPDQPEDQ